jgi:hypothetical protein
VGFLVGIADQQGPLPASLFVDPGTCLFLGAPLCLDAGAFLGGVAGRHHATHGAAAAEFALFSVQALGNGTVGGDAAPWASMQV